MSVEGGLTVRCSTSAACVITQLLVSSCPTRYEPDDYVPKTVSKSLFGCCTIRGLLKISVMAGASLAPKMYSLVGGVGAGKSTLNADGFTAIKSEPSPGRN